MTALVREGIWALRLSCTTFEPLLASQKLDFLYASRHELSPVQMNALTKVKMTNGKKQITNVFEAILEYGHDEDFVPYESVDFSSTDAPAGSDEKIEALRRRVLKGQPLWHEEDREDYSGLSGAVRPRD